MLKPKKSIEKMSGYFVPMYEKHWEVKIDSNENNYGASDKVKEALKSLGAEEISLYPFYGELSEKIAAFRGCAIDNIKVTNGADEALQGIIQTYLEAGEALLTLDISFEMPAVYAEIQGGEVIRVPYKGKWKFPLEDFLKELKNEKVKIVYLASPNNPTGSIIEENELAAILENSSGKAVIIDETYANYADNTFQKYIEKYDNVFIVRSFSKDAALAGLRLGYIISCAENIKNLKKVISPFSVNAAAVKAGIAALEDFEYFIGIKKEIIKTKKEMTEFFDGLGFRVYPSEANFLLIDCGKKAEFIYNVLKRAGISVKLFKRGCRLEGHIRVTIPAPEGFKKLKEALKIKTCLVFDMDGVLINADSYRKTIQKTFEKYTGKSISKENIQKAKNSGGLNNDWDLTLYLLQKEGINVSYEDLVKTFQEIYWNEGKGLINEEEPLFNRDKLEALSRKYNLAIFTGRPKKEAEFALNKFNVSDLFYPVITADDIPHGKGKPDPMGLNKVKELSAADEYYYSGDTPDDMKCACAAGFRAIGVLPPQVLNRHSELGNKFTLIAPPLLGEGRGEGEAFHAIQGNENRHSKLRNILFSTILPLLQRGRGRGCSIYPHQTLKQPRNKSGAGLIQGDENCHAEIVSASHPIQGDEHPVMLNSFQHLFQLLIVTLKQVQGDAAGLIQGDENCHAELVSASCSKQAEILKNLLKENGAECVIMSINELQTVLEKKI